MINIDFSEEESLVIEMIRRARIGKQFLAACGGAAAEGVDAIKTRHRLRARAAARPARRRSSSASAERRTSACLAKGAATR
jgi:hypothetical protein